jgi:hypothetical protein
MRGVSGQRHALAALSPGERTLSTHCIGGWVGPRAGLDTQPRGKILSPLPGIEPRLPCCSARSHTLYWLSYPTHIMTMDNIKIITFMTTVVVSPVKRVWHADTSCSIFTVRVQYLCTSCFIYNSTSVDVIIFSNAIMKCAYCYEFAGSISQWNFIALQKSIHYS